MPVVDNRGTFPLEAIPVGAAQWATPRHAHLVGIAGAGMRSLAGLLLQCGWTVSGSDLNSRGAEPLLARGVRVEGSHAQSHVPHDAALVVHSDAVAADNPELLAACLRGLPVYSYFEMLAQITRATRSLAIAGTHGKSTTTAMAAAILEEAGCDPTVVYGAAPRGAAFGARLGRSPWTLVEACEYRANFLHLQPEKAVILGMESDHFDYYQSGQQLQAAFDQFAIQVRPEGYLLVRYECLRARQAAAGALAEVETFGWDQDATWSARDVRHTAGSYRFSIYRRDRQFAEVQLQTPGRHNVLNALAAAALSCQCGAGAQAIARGLAKFVGLARRMEFLGSHAGVDVWDDYAHHPTEVSAALQTIREMYPKRRVCCVFQPHQASRTAHLLDELAQSLENSDRVYVAQIFRAREKPAAEGEVTAADLAAQLRRRNVAVGAEHELSAIVETLRRERARDEVVVTLGAGDIRVWTDALVAALRGV